MSSSAPRSSVFTFESTPHSSRVLRRLDEQRRRDTLCDVTVVVEGQSFRAHRSVLASCSEYFTNRTSALTQRHGALVTLPPEVTVSGFEPLLKFAYTSKLLFGKDDVLEIRNAASVLGFRDLDEACFDFLLPKFFCSSEGSAPRKTCCKKKCKRRPSKDDDDALLDEKEVKPAADSPPRQEAARHGDKPEQGIMGNASTPAAEGTRFTRCPKYRKFQLACGKETCVAEKRPVTVIIRDDCDLSCSSPKFAANSTSNSTGRRGADGEVDVIEKDTNERQRKWNETEGDGSNVEADLGERSPGLTLHHGPRTSFGEGAAVTRSLGHKRFAMDAAEGKKATDCGLLTPVSAHRNADEREMDSERAQTGGSNAGEMRAVEREVAEHLARRLGSDDDHVRSNFRDPDAGSSSDTGTSLERMKSHNAGSSSCPFLQDLDQSKCSWKGAELSECEGASQSGVSSPNSGEDGDSETEGDSESYTRERARQVQLPFSVDWIVDLSRNDFQQLLKQQVFTREQLEFVHDMRRRSKNRLAAQRCRKRKLDCIYNLQCEINKLKTEREKLMTEKSRLNQLKSNTRLSVSALCQRVCSEANLQPDQLQVFAKYTSTDCPLSSLLPHIDELLSPPPPPPQASLSARFNGLDDSYVASEDARSGSCRDAVTGDAQHPL